MFGDKVLPILPHLTIYGLAMVLFTINRTLSSYHMAKRQYSIGLVSLVGVVVMGIGLALFHSSLKDFTLVIVFAACIDTISIVVWRMWQRHGRFVFRILIDALDVLAPLPELVTPINGKKILIFNWRDTKHAMAGGAEVYIHELAKRWVALGNQVTLFAGNDGKSKREEEVDGVLVIRRGGFWLVFFWGFVYYLFKFRGRYDLIIDGHNGIPFFTPFYAKEQTFCLLHHVHQHIFQKYLPLPLAKLACFLEAKLIPFTYRHIPFLTVSESSKHDMEKLGIGRAGITIINPGVSLGEFIPGKKALMPTILYLGRLKEYKSIPVLLEAFQKVKDEVVGPRLVIAGEGDEFEKLRLLAKRLGLNGSVSFLGRVDEKSKIELMQQAWVFVNPSLMEGWGITSIEANACGTPVIASDVPGLRDSVKDPQSGFLVEHGQVEALAEKIILLLNDEVVRHRMSEEARAWAGNFSWDILAEKCLARVNTGGGE
jgi:glycosyltransferase involved in cell wall biosynthesis